MTKVTVKKDAAGATPSEELIADAAKEVDVSYGDHVLTLKRPSVLVQWRLPKALGSELSQNAAYMTMCAPLLFVAKIDGVAVSPIRGDRDIEALVQRLGEDGLNALMRAYMETWGPKDEAVAKDEVKN